MDKKTNTMIYFKISRDWDAAINKNDFDSLSGTVFTLHLQ